MAAAGPVTVANTATAAAAPAMSAVHVPLVAQSTTAAGAAHPPTESASRCWMITLASSSLMRLVEAGTLLLRPPPPGRCNDHGAEDGEASVKLLQNDQ